MLFLVKLIVLLDVCGVLVVFVVKFDVVINVVENKSFNNVFFMIMNFFFLDS